MKTTPGSPQSPSPCADYLLILVATQPFLDWFRLYLPKGIYRAWLDLIPFDHKMALKIGSPHCIHWFIAFITIFPVENDHPLVHHDKMTKKIPRMGTDFSQFQTHVTINVVKYSCCLVVYLPLSKIMGFVSWDDYSFRKTHGKIKHVWNQQPAYIIRISIYGLFYIIINHILTIIHYGYLWFSTLCFRLISIG